MAFLPISFRQLLQSGLKREESSTKIVEACQMKTGLEIIILSRLRHLL